ncbi:MAG: hypothetical protein UR39_C0013G0007 [Candidatus Woesebacteria bacterium GW2011_GWA1_33_30]|uniref:site-specific DNA-methyltransferase (adenine-specific) n=1 Tax=Candidatus Woesebacteria bacterium GW2011_GWA2_33_28 TaxID=1618561 RepID=A0A0G0CSE1_9BACT|nr:MAG: hypothetical protein UR38_C0013G0022 [Candidatus Woesebacteria bacterium GW2011_GWA2_33_28]KKP46815.1 MAG: hypothetical protein UR39_C0013G0007 [Candidatus Woesebacteria bacterium GW2011_GWA1_33_30]KKP48459.1 MAG: hypothetical protein UR40_C0014G0007 [Microgenomates group bacterium GW2011_GWC1_33_32]KKP51306.1 MAG: hypothetical protein UR44_C0013G0009 [Candidatus Woesebacteria bacterium GW2011_GWB1_33_38]
MSEAKQILETLINDFSIDKFGRFFREKSRQFKSLEENYTRYNDDNFKSGLKIGEINFDDEDSLTICAFEVKKELSERAGKKAQYQKAKDILKSSENQKYSAGIFIFYDSIGNFRFSLVYPEAIGTRRQWNNFRRFTYFVNKEFTNKTFIKQIGDKEFLKLDDIKYAFSITAVTDIFYDEFFTIYDSVVKKTKEFNQIKDDEKVRDFVLLFTIRLVFLGFIQKKKWIGESEKFIQEFFSEYRIKFFGDDNFYLRWLTPLFFEALNFPQGRKVAYGDNDFAIETENKLQMAPYLNGGLFKPKIGYDDNGWIIPDKEIEYFLSFLFAHSFTIEENSFEDEDLQLNPEFLGIIFERLVNKVDGAVYTPRTEVNLMCRLSLVKWLQKNLKNPISSTNLYELFFRESEKVEDQKQGSFSQKEALEILEKLQNLSICDPAVGSGAFLVGMMQVLDDTEQVLKVKYNLNGKSTFDRKKEIIKNSLYGVEVKEWAVWICQLRLWLSLFVDAPDNLKNSLLPILPSLDFKVRQGDSLIQRIGSKTFPVEGHLTIQSNSIKRKITELKKFKIDYFENDKSNLLEEYDNPYRRELVIFEEILDLEIKEKEDQLRILKNIKPIKTISLFGDIDDVDKQGSLGLDSDKISNLENEVTQLKDQRRILKNGGKPLVWSIEFAEVFAEKNGFDIIIGNPPYVRQESISDPTGKIKDKKEYKRFLEEMVKMDFSEDFSKKTKINAQSDLYTYFYIRGLRLLNQGGIHTFICSNSWLDVGYGVWLQDFLLKRCPVDLIIDNHARRSFEAADVNTIISIIHAPQKKIDENYITKFVAFKKPFEESVFTENLVAIENSKEVTSNDTLRVYPITNKKLKETGTEFEDNELMKSGKYVGDKWGGKYLRAPDIFFTILKKGKDKLVKLGDIADVRFGIKTGANDFFYLNEEKIKLWGIEKEFLQPVIISPRECKEIFISPNKLSNKILICAKTKEELNGTNVLKYINYGEKEKIIIKQGSNKGNTIVGYQNLESVKGRKYWWNLDNLVHPYCSYPMINNIRLIFIKNNGILNDANLVSVLPKNESIEFLLNLNSTYNMMNLELLGMANLGEGAIKLNPAYIKGALILDPKYLDFGHIDTSKFINRAVKSIFEECGIDPKSDIPIEEQEPKPLSDRAELDKIIFDALDLTEVERKDVYRSVCRLVWNRISKAKNI